MKAKESHSEVTTAARVWRLLLAAVFILQQPVSTAVIVVDGGCGLADAITAANNDAATGGCPAGAGTDEIQLTGDVTLIEALPRAAGPVIFEGNSHTVTRHPAVSNFRIFEMGGPGSVILRNMTVSNGHASRGGGIYNDTTLTIVNSTITGNTADTKGGGIFGDYSGNINLIESTISNNYAFDDAGGMYVSFGSFSTIDSSTISGNVAATGHGGGFYNPGYSYMTIVNSTISGNTAGGRGGGIYNAFYAGDIDLVNTTIVGNTASNGGGFYAYPVFSAPRETPEGHYTDIFMEGSLIAANIGGNCAGDGQHDLGGNFDDDGSCEGASPVIADVDFDSALADNGGPTLTHALLAGSVAIDAGGACGLAEDQRGLPRDALCDSGSYEFGAEPSGFGGTASGIRGRTAMCRNFTTGMSVQIALTGVSVWSCETAGLTVNSGNTIGQTLNGAAQGPISGRMFEIVASEVTCQNRSTGQQVSAPLDANLNWDCITAGLTASPGDRIRIAVQGTAP